MENNQNRHFPSNDALAFLGDAVHSLYIRRELVEEGVSRAKDLNILAQKYVTAGAQARAFSVIEDMLTVEEKDIFRRAANSSHLRHPKNTPISVYRTASGFEALLGALFICGNDERIEELLKKIKTEVDRYDTEN